MGSKAKISAHSTAAGRRRSRPPKSHKSLTAAPQARRRGSAHTSSSGEVVYDKLETLRDLIQSRDDGINPERLFRETTDYILLLKAQVFVLQKLVGFYGSQPQENRDAT